MALVSCMCEAIVEAPIINVLSMFVEIDLFKDWFPNVTSCDVLKPVTPSRGMYTCKQTMPWPLWPRDMTFGACGMIDKKNLGVLTVIKSVQEGEDYFGVKVPPTADGHVRIDLKRGYHYFQRIDENTTRYIMIFNSDPQLQYAPGWVMNNMMTKICYQMLVVIQQKAQEGPTNEFGRRILSKTEFYGDLERRLKEIIDAQLQ